MIALVRSFKLVIFMMQLTIIGFGNQAKSWALNLKDSGFPVAVALRAGSSSIAEAKSLGFEILEVGSEKFYEQKTFALLTPDNSHHDFLQEFGSGFKSDSTILYAHGFSLLKFNLNEKFSNLNHVLYAPKSIGSELRKQFVEKGKLGAVYSLEFFKGDKKIFEKWLLKLAIDMGINMGPFLTTVKNETKADLYSEQGLLCSLIPYAASELFDHLVESGVEPELAYFECWYELKLIINAMVDKGPEGFFDLISPNALLGSEKGYHRLFTPEFKQNLRSLLNEIEDGTFDKEIDLASIPEVRNTIRLRWQKTKLMKAFHQIQQDQK